MANVILARPNWVAGSNFATPSIGAAYGSFEASMPASEILTPYLAEPARSTDATAASTKVRINLGLPRNVAVVAIPKSNVSVDGQIRITAYSDSGYSVAVYEGALVDYWSDVYPWGSRPWGSGGLMSAKITPEDADGYPAVYYVVLPAVVIAQYWQIEFVDEANADGYVEIARVVLAPAWQSSINFLPGQSSIQWETASTVRKGRTGVRFVDRKPNRRVTRLAFDFLGEDEAFAQPFEMARKEDLDGEVFIITDPDDTTLALQRAFLANLRVLPSLSYGIVDTMSVAVELEEAL